jgi:hypothetical protein
MREHAKKKNGEVIAQLYAADRSTSIGATSLPPLRADGGDGSLQNLYGLQLILDALLS